jgi:hypothetical protein
VVFECHRRTEIESIVRVEDQSSTVDRMHAHDRDLLRHERTGLLHDLQRHLHLAKVVQ